MRRRNFFAELLPEGTALDNLATETRVSTDDVIPLLAQFGRDVAGAVQIYDPDAPGEPRRPDLALIDAAGVGRMLGAEITLICVSASVSIVVLIGSGNG